MRKTLFAIPLLAFSLLFIQPVPTIAQKAAPTAGWEAIGPPGGDVVDLVASPADASRLYAVIGTPISQLFTSANSGQSWTRLSARLGDTVYSLAIDPTDPAVMYGLGIYGVSKSTDGGVNWKRTDLMDYFYGADGDIAVHPLDHNLIIATGYFHGRPPSASSCIAYFRSTDAGATWSRVPVNLASSDGRGLSLAIDPSNLTTAYIGGYERDSIGTIKGKVYRTLDGGLHWTDMTRDFVNAKVESVVLDPENPARIFAGTASGVLRSSDGGLTWSRNEGQAFTHELLLDPAHANTLYAGWEDSVYRTSDGGITWTVRPMGRAGSCRSLLAAGGHIFYGSNMGVLKSDDAGATWQSSQGGLNASDVRSCVVVPSRPGLILAAVGPRIYRTTDGGATWGEPIYIFEATAVAQVVADPSNSDRLFALVQGCGSG